MTGWKFSCIKCNKSVYIRCSNCSSTKFREVTHEIFSPKLECGKCKNQPYYFNHNCRGNNYCDTSFAKSRERFSKIDSKPWLARYTDQ